MERPLHEATSKCFSELPSPLPHLEVADSYGRARQIPGGRSGAGSMPRRRRVPIVKLHS